MDNPDENLQSKLSSARPSGGIVPYRTHYKHTRKIFWSFIVIFIVFLGFLGVISTKHPAGLNTSVNDFFTLHEVFHKQGIKRFLEEKESLKSKVSENIANPKSSQAKKLAESIAVYLFPEILPDTHFEKEAAMTLWMPLFKKIEKKPGTPEARHLYEEAKAEIMNYENPSKQDPNLSDPAKETLKIYRELSAP